MKLKETTIVNGSQFTFETELTIEDKFKVYAHIHQKYPDTTGTAYISRKEIKFIMGSDSYTCDLDKVLN